MCIGGGGKKKCRYPGFSSFSIKFSTITKKKRPQIQPHLASADALG